MFMDAIENIGMYLSGSGVTMFIPSFMIIRQLVE